MDYSDVFKFSSRPVDNFQQTLHHAAADESFTAGLVACKMVKKTEERRCQEQREGLSIGLWRSQGRYAGSNEHRKEPMIRSRTGHVNDHV